MDKSKKVQSVQNLSLLGLVDVSLMNVIGKRCLVKDDVNETTKTKKQNVVNLNPQFDDDFVVKDEDVVNDEKKKV
jgi:hypothetical protein